MGRGSKKTGQERVNWKMKTTVGAVGGRLVVFAFLLFLTAGCNNNGLNADNSIPAAASLSALNEPSGSDGLGDMAAANTFSDSGVFNFSAPGPMALSSIYSYEGDSDQIGGDREDNGASDDNRENFNKVVAKVHNLEPASVVLLGIGLVGLLRRKKLKVKHSTTEYVCENLTEAISLLFLKHHAQS